MNNIMNKKKKIIIGVNVVLFIVVIISLVIFGIQSKTESASTIIEKAQNDDNEKTTKEPILVEIEDIENIDELTEQKEEKSDNKKIDTSMTYYIKVNYGAQVVTVYKKDEQNEYTIPVKAMVCSTGVHTPTSGVYSIPSRWEWLGLQGDVYGHYCTQIKGNILFHSVPYLTKYDNGSLEYWEYDKLGTYASAGCVRLTVRDAKWIFDNCARGTNVEFYSSSDPGPLGKPSARKISSYPDELRNWDPTDPDSDNPWYTYSEGQEQKKEENKKEDKDKESQTKANTIVNDVINTTVNQNIVTNENIVTNTITNENIVDNTLTNTTISENVVVDEKVNTIVNENVENDNITNSLEN